MQTPSRNSWSLVPHRMDYRDELQEYTALGWSMANGTSMTAFSQAAAVAHDNMRHTVATPSHHTYDRRDHRLSYTTTTAPRSRPRSGTVGSQTSRPQTRSTKPSAQRSSSANSAHRIPRKPVRITSTERIELENLPFRSHDNTSLDALAALLGTKGVADEHTVSVPLPLGKYNQRLSQASPRPRLPSFTEEAKNWAVASLNAPLKRVKKLSDAARGRRHSRVAVAVSSYTAGHRGSLQTQTPVYAASGTSERPHRNRSTTPAPQVPHPRIHAPGVYDAAAEWAVVPCSAGPAPTSRASRRQGMIFEDSFDVNAVDPREQAYLQLEGWSVVNDYDHGTAMQSVRQHRLRRQPSMGTVRTMGTVASRNALNDFAYAPGHAYTPGQVGIMGKFKSVKSLNNKLVGLFK